MEDINTNNVPSVPIAKSENSTAGSNPRMASFLDRFVALIIDSIVVSIISVPFGLLLGGFGGSDSSVYYGSGVGLLASFLYFGYFYTTRGQSVGKIVMKIKVVRSSDLKFLSWGEVFMRDILGKIVSGLLLDLGYLWYFMSEKRQTWHDSIASTYVVKTDDAGNLLMDGPALYPKEPVKTFGCCALIGILVAAIIGLVIYVLASFLSNIDASDLNLDQYMQQGIPYEGGAEGPTDEGLRKFLEENPDSFEDMHDFDLESTPQEETQTL